VTKEDYEARVLNIPAKFGNIAKAYVSRDTAPEDTSELTVNLQSAIQNLQGLLNEVNNTDDYNTITTLPTILSGILQEFPNEEFILDTTIGTINIYVLGYNNKKQLVGNPHANTLNTNDNLPTTLTTNIKNYLENFKLMTDVVTINDGYIVNFGVFFDVIAEKYADKQKVKLDCIQKIKDYFRIEKMQFNQPIYKSNLEFELMGVEGVRSIGHVTITQDVDYFYEDGESLTSPTYTYSYDNSAQLVDIDGDGILDGSFISATGGTAGYGYKYNFKNALSADGTIVLPPNTATPSVFELKNPNTNIQGRVR